MGMLLHRHRLLREAAKAEAEQRAQQAAVEAEQEPAVAEVSSPAPPEVSPPAVDEVVQPQPASAPSAEAAGDDDVKPDTKRSKRK